MLRAALSIPWPIQVMEQTTISDTHFQQAVSNTVGSQVNEEKQDWLVPRTTVGMTALVTFQIGSNAGGSWHPMRLDQMIKNDRLAMQDERQPQHESH